jgi:hypothetical protein
MSKKQKLELTWIGKENRPRLEPRILLEDPEKSYHAAHRVMENDLFDNKLICGDNLLALKALEQGFTGKIKCIYVVRAINELKPVLGLELTATPFVEGPKGAVAFKNVIYELSAGEGDGGRFRERAGRGDAKEL